MAVVGSGADLKSHTLWLTTVSSHTASASERALCLCMTRPIEFIEQEIAIRHWVGYVWHIEVVVEVVQLRWLRRWRHDAHAHSLLLWMLRREAKASRLLLRVGMAIWRHVSLSYRCRRWLGTLSCVLAATALSPARCAVVLHDRRTIAASTAVQTALLADGPWVLVGLVITSPAIEVERGLYVGLLVGWLCDGRFEWVDV